MEDDLQQLRRAVLTLYRLARRVGPRTQEEAALLESVARQLRQDEAQPSQPDPALDDANASATRRDSAQT
jgi:hypothetical protein